MTPVYDRAGTKQAIDHDQKERGHFRSGGIIGAAAKRVLRSGVSGSGFSLSFSHRIKIPEGMSELTCFLLWLNINHMVLVRGQAAGGNEPETHAFPTSCRIRSAMMSPTKAYAIIQNTQMNRFGAVRSSRSSPDSLVGHSIQIVFQMS
ncbi:hypothetical protein HK13_11170 [Acetobacter indonesiensis]|nr:hypothetical protein HK13_11170 [Acetobacter indonesiensis]